MLQLLNPLWLWAIAGIIVPVLVHLWHIKTGKTLKIGSLTLLSESARQSSRSFRITDWPLLLLRCLLLLLLAFLLTEPFWQKQAETIKTKGWILIEKQRVKETYNHFKPTIDSLLKTGYQLHEFDASFKAVKLEEVLKERTEVMKTQQKPTSYWALSKLIEQQLPQKLPVYLFTSNQLQYFQNKRPEINFNLHWKTYTPADSVSTWIQSAYLTSSDAVSVIVGNSNANRTSFNTVNLRSGEHSNPVFNISVLEGKPFVSFKNGSQKSVPVDTSTLKITVFQNQFPADAAYLQAALQAVKKFSGRKIKISSASNFNRILNNQDWIFWLSNQIPPKNLNQKLVKNGQVFQYETGKAQAVNSWISSADEFTGNESEPINLYQHFLADKRSIADTKTVWQNGFAQPILSLQKSENLNIYRFYSRFNPSWNDLVWSSDFPKMMLKLILKSYPQPDFMLNDKRIIGANQQQISAANAADTSFISPRSMDQTDLKHACWIALFLVFLLERIISTQTKKQEIYG